MDAFWSGERQGEYTEGLLLRPSGRLIKGWVWAVHPQLRNGLAVSPLNPSHFYLNQQKGLAMLNIATGQKTVVWPTQGETLSTEITCFSVIDHYLAIGTDDGQLIVLDIAKGHKKLLDRAMAPFSRMVNAIVGFFHGGERRIIVCSNNHFLKVFKFPELVSVSSIDLGRATNFAALSPDGQWMVAVGDRSELYVFAAGEQNFHLKHVVPHIGDEVFGGNGSNMVSWEPHPPYRFAVACEVGATLIFAYPGAEDWTPNPLYYLWGHDLAPWTHATSFPIDAETAGRRKRDIESGSHMSSAKFISTSSATETGSSLLVACNAGQSIHVYDLERKLRQAIKVSAIPCVALCASQFAGDNDDDGERMEISGVVASGDGSKLYVSFELALSGEQQQGYIVELVVNKLASLRSQCIRFVKQHLDHWHGVDWEEILPASILCEIFSPYKFPV